MRLRDKSLRADKFHLSDTRRGLVYDTPPLDMLVRMCDYDDDIYDKHLLRSMVIPKKEIKLHVITQHYFTDTLRWLCAILYEGNQRLQEMCKMMEGE